MKINIMHVLYSFGLGGLEGGIASLIDTMDQDRFSHSICVFKDDLASLKKIKSTNIKVYVVKRFFGNDPSLIFRLCAFLKRHRPDIVRTYNWAGVEGIIAARLCGIRAVIHSEHGFDIDEISRKKARRVLARRLVLPRCDRIIAVARSLQRWLIDDVGIKSERVAYIPNGCDVARFYPGKDAGLRRNLGIEDDEAVIGTVGSLTGLKDQKGLLEAFAKVSAGRHKLKLLIVGQGPLRKDLEALAKQLVVRECTVFTGAVAESAPYYRAMDIFVLPSISENMPNALLQAMATALPVIATDVGDVRYMTDGEKGGMLVKPKDVLAIEKGIGYFLDDPAAAKDRGGFARKRVEQGFDIRDTAKKYESLYVSAVGGG